MDHGTSPCASGHLRAPTRGSASRAPPTGTVCGVRSDFELSSLPGSARTMGVLAVAVAVVLAIGWMERLLGFRSPVFALNLHFLLMTGAVFADKLWAPKLASPRFEVSDREVRLYRRLGVVGFMRLLRRIGWTAANRDPTVFDGTRRTVPSYERATRHGENAHTWLFLIGLGPVAWSIAHRWWDATFWFSTMNVVLHLYPVMLQRTQRARLSALVVRLARHPSTEGQAGLPRTCTSCSAANEAGFDLCRSCGARREP